MTYRLENSGREVQLARKIQFSSAHLYEQKAWSKEKNLEAFGACYTPHGHGHNYTLEAFFTGQINNKTGLVVNLTDADKLLKKIIAPLDHQHLNFDVAHFRDLVPTTENIAKYCFEQIHLHIGNLPMRLLGVRLYETEDLWVDYWASHLNTKPLLPRLTREYVLSALHNLHNPDISDAENSSLYGMCYRLHGHHYKIQVSVFNPNNEHKINDTTGLIYNRDLLDNIVKTEIIDRFEGKNLNDFYVNTSGESLTCVFFDLLDPHFAHGSLHSVAIQETRKNWFEYRRP